MRQGKMVGIPN